MRLQSLGLLLIFAGMILAMIAVFLPIVFMVINENIATTGKGIDIKIGAGGCILVFFIPICFGLGEYSVFLMIIAIVLAMVVVLISYILYRNLKRQVSYISPPS